MNFLENLRAVVALLGLGTQFAAGELSPEEQALSAGGKRNRAIELVFGDNYEDYKTFLK